MTRPHALALLAVLLLAALSGASGCAPERQQWEDTYEGDGEDLFLVDDDFTCLDDATWTEIDGTRIVNLLGHQEEAEAVAREPVEGARYPVGTLIQLFADEAMVKRGAGFSPETDDWEFFVLHVGTGNTVITSRGTTEVANPAGSCMSCHAAARDFDNVCFTNSACAPLPFFIDTNVDPKTEDARCAGR